MQIILLNTPQVVAFEQRAVVLHTLILSDQSENGMVNGSLRFDGSEGTVRIRRNEIIGDAFMALDHLGKTLTVCTRLFSDCAACYC